MVQSILWGDDAVIGRFHYDTAQQGWMLYRNSLYAAGNYWWLMQYNTTSDLLLNIGPQYINLSANTWYHAALVLYSNGSYRTFLNGKPYSALLSVSSFAKWGGNKTNEMTRLAIGRASDSQPWYLDGAVDDIAIFNRSLPAENILELYQERNYAIEGTPIYLNISVELPPGGTYTYNLSRLGSAAYRAPVTSGLYIVRLSDRYSPTTPRIFDQIFTCA